MALEYKTTTGRAAFDDDPSPPANGDGWTMCGSAMNQDVILWFWKRETQDLSQWGDVPEVVSGDWKAATVENALTIHPEWIIVVDGPHGRMFGPLRVGSVAPMSTKPTRAQIADYMYECIAVAKQETVRVANEGS